MQDKKISVIIPAYNSEKYIEDCVKSVINQSYKNVEIIIINDGSTDGTAKKCEEIIHQCGEKIKYFEIKNSGAGMARNYGLDNATGDYICFLDSDDELHPDFVSFMLEKVQEDIDIVCCSYYILETRENEYFYDNDFDAITRKEKELLYLQLMNPRYGNNRNNKTAIGVPWAKLIRRELLDENNIRFYDRPRVMEDNLFCMRAFCCARTVKYCNANLYVYRISHITNIDDYSPETYYEFLEKRELFYRENTDENTSTIITAREKEKIELLVAGIRYIVGHEKDRRISRNKLRELLNREIYRDCVKRIDPDILKRKHRILYPLIKRKAITLLIEIMKLRQLVRKAR